MLDTTKPCGVLCVDKPLGPTSHDVVGTMRRILRTREIGHTGTLDPQATGLLILAVGEATKLVPWLTAEHKRYRTTIQLGQVTDTLDAAGVIQAHKSVPTLTTDALQHAANTFVGLHPQQVPMVSAVKVNGQRLHDAARKGVTVTPPTKAVALKSVHVVGWDGSTSQVDVELHTGSGFFVRSFARDLAEKLGTLGHVLTLRRTHIGPLSTTGAFVAPLRASDFTGAPPTLTAIESALALPKVEIDENTQQRLRFGQRLRRDDLVDGDYQIVCAERLVAIARVAEHRLSVVRNLNREALNEPSVL